MQPYKEKTERRFIMWLFLYGGIETLFFDKKRLTLTVCYGNIFEHVIVLV